MSLALLCLLVALPFISAVVIGLVPSLRRMCARHPRLTRSVGLAGLGLLLAGLVGVLSQPAAFPLTLAGGLVSGFSMFSSRCPGSEGDGDGWERRPPSPHGMPPRPRGDGPDWEDFDRLRADWERRGLERDRITRFG